MYQKEIKVGNENKLFRYIFNTEHSFSIPELAKANDMSFPTVKRVINKFLEKEIIYEWTLSSGGVGRRAVEYKYNCEFCYSLGVRINEEKIRILLTDAKGNKIIYKSYDYNSDSGDILVVLIDALKSFISELDLKYSSKIIGIGISIPGIYNKESAFLEFTLSRRHPASSLQQIENELSLPVWVENEANMSILAEAIIGNHKNLTDFTVINISNNVTCSTFHKFGTTSDEYFFKASRVHHMIIDYEQQKKVGDCISYKVLIEKIKKIFPEVESLKGFFGNSKIFNSREGQEIIKEFLRYMGIILKNLLYTYNPRKLIICGEIANYEEFLLNDILNIVYEENHNFYRGRETIHFSKFKGDSSIIGAAIFPIVDKLM
ncbi:MAG: ROK family protein [Fusobacterium gastrosuis]|uniref:ROK family protein n=1 Tax=Fusobacterium gastrosuis TaxID=1755100 RepID=UPI001F4F13E4|nr:ROK family protein [Fusobacterium gastrosuis]MDD7392716.1 ROK family protein [Fusobacteriaceae bacterium]MDY5794552.1 ROK family protein [Fusobacterium gastrosuis]